MTTDLQIFLYALSELKTDENAEKISNIMQNSWMLFNFLEEEEDYRYSRAILDKLVELREKHETCSSSHLLLQHFIKDVFVLYSSKL